LYMPCSPDGTRTHIDAVFETAAYTILLQGHRPFGLLSDVLYVDCVAEATNLSIENFIILSLS
jgi:hypothetical protein